MTGPVSLIFTILISIFLSGCAATSNRQALKDTGAKLERDQGAFISTPKNGLVRQDLIQEFRKDDGKRNKGRIL